MISCLRPQPDCDADVAELTRRAVQSVALPMLQVAFLSGPPVLFSSADQPGDYQGIIITSKHASRYLADQLDDSSELRCLPIWCVGSGSANILRKAGFAIAYAGKGNAADLADQVCQQRAAGPFLWLSGRDVHLDIAAHLKAQGITVKRQVVYSGRILSIRAEREPLTRITSLGWRVRCRRGSKSPGFSVTCTRRWVVACQPSARFEA